VKVTSLSEKALNYMGEGNLKHKVLALEEGAGAEDASYAIRNLISSGVLTTQVAGRDPKTGKLRTDSHKTEGPTAVLVTSTQPDTDAETKSRFIIMGIDESKEQTRKILEFQRKRHTLDGLKEDTQAKETVNVHRNFQRLLKSVKVVNPVADRLTYTDDRLQSRRAQPQYLNLIKAIAFMRQMQKETKKHGEINYIEVDEVDLELGNKLATEILGKSLDELSIPARNLLNNLFEMVTAKKEKLCEGKQKTADKIATSSMTFTRREAREFTGWNNTRLHNHIKELLSLEYLVQESGRGTALQAFRLLYEGEGKDGEKFLPGLKE
jgi:DNA primase